MNTSVILLLVLLVLPMSDMCK